MHKEYLKHALIKMQDDLFEVIKTGRWKNTSYVLEILLKFINHKKFQITKFCHF